MVNDLTHDLAQMCVDADICTELDSDIFYDYMPAEVDEAVMILERSGTPVAAFTTTSVRSITTLVRSRSAATARTKCWQIFELVCVPDRLVDIGTVRSIVSVRQTPIAGGTDSLGRYLWLFSMGVTYRYK